MVVSDEIEISGLAEKGWQFKVMRSSNRNFPWRDIVCELIDNAIQFRKKNQPAQIEIIWLSGKRQYFHCEDDGIGSNDIAAFLQPGRSEGAGIESGSSTFGTGLYGIECHLDGEMLVTTWNGSSNFWQVQRVVRTMDTGLAREYEATEANISTIKCPSSGGTLISFHGFKKRVPTQSDFLKIAEHVSRSYAVTIKRCEARITFTLNGRSLTIQPEERPELEQVHQESIVIDGNRFDIEWGVTTDKVKGEQGCRLIYGGKEFEVTTLPCGDYLTGRFYASIVLPKSIGSETMDVFKRSVDHSHEILSELYSQSFKLFEPQLKRSDELCSVDEDEEFNEAIRQCFMLHSGVDERKNDCEAIVKGGDEDLRNFKGRDTSSKGVQPQGTQRKRVGRSRKASRKFDATTLKISFENLGEDKDIAKYSIADNRLVYNLDDATVVSLKEVKATDTLAAYGRAHVAIEIDKQDPQKRFGYADDSFGQILKKLATHKC